jgi:hypothetical protein
MISQVNVRENRMDFIDPSDSVSYRGAVSWNIEVTNFTGFQRVARNFDQIPLDCITTPAPETRVDYGLSTTKGSGERSRTC